VPDEIHELALADVEVHVVQREGARDRVFEADVMELDHARLPVRSDAEDEGPNGRIRIGVTGAGPLAKASVVPKAEESAWMSFMCCPKAYRKVCSRWFMRL
jgi:hypothetical protein